MARQFSGNMDGEQYLGNTNNKEVHDLDKENTNLNGCQIDEIIAAGLDRSFNSLSAAHSEAYDNCAKCLAGSTR